MEYEVTRFTEFLHARKTVGPFRLGNMPKRGKIHGKNFAGSCGVGVAKQLAEFAGPDSVDFSILPDRSVLKATTMYSCKGVYLLKRSGVDFYEMLRKKVMSSHEILEDMKSAYLSLGRPWSQIILEEFLAGENGPDQIPYDYKFFMFGGVVGVILQIDRNAKPMSLAAFGPGFQTLGEGLMEYLKGFVPGQPVVPANAGALIEAARRISLKLDIPFCGVDLYTTGRDVFFGEITPVPGLPYQGRRLRFSPEFDAALGALWKAECNQRGLPIPKISSPPPALIRDSQLSDTPCNMAKISQEAVGMSAASVGKLLST